MTWPRLAALAAAAALTVPAAPHAEDNPFVGTWKLNAARSQLAGDTMRFAAQRGGKIRFTAAGQSYTFRPDGKPRNAIFRQKVAWIRVDDRTWRAEWKVKKRTIVTEMLEVAPDGKTLRDTARGSRADGTPYEDSVLYERTAGEGSSLFGTWRSTRVDLGGLQTIAIEPHAQHGIVLTMVDFNSTCTARLDGADYAFRGPMTPPGLTFSFRPSGERELHVIQKQDGVALYTGALSVDADGRTLTWEWRPKAVDEPVRAVFDRQ